MVTNVQGYELLLHEREGLRVSIAFFLLEAAIDQLLAALGRLQRSKA